MSASQKNWIILGPSGSGKTTFARELGERVGVSPIEVDAHFWAEGWIPVDSLELQEKVLGLLDSAVTQGWIVEGHDTKIRLLTWPRADQVVWLDYPPALIRFRLVKKILANALSRRVLWNGNRENLARALFGPDSRLYRGWRDAGIRNREYAELFEGKISDFDLHRFQTPRQARRWLALLRPNPPELEPAGLVEFAGGEAALLSLSEVGVGSLLHGLQVPLAGHFLSLNQGFLLSRSLRKAAGQAGIRHLPVTISGVSAILKSLSPAGKKLTPMLAISAQGCLFGLGSACFGSGLAGAILGSVLASLWAFFQPFLLYYAFYGELLARMGNYFVEKMREAFHFDPAHVFWVVLAVLTLKALSAAGLALYAFHGNPKSLEAFEEALMRAGRRALASRASPAITGSPSTDSCSPREWKQSAQGAFKDLLQPLFIFSIAMTAGFLILCESRATLTIWILLRPLAIGFILFFAVRILPVDRLAARLVRRRNSAFARSLGSAIDTLRRI